MKVLILVGCLACLAWPATEAKEDKQDSLFSWSNLSFHSSSPQDSEEDDMATGESQTYTKEVLPEISASSPEGRTSNPRLRRRRFRKRRPVASLPEFEYEDDYNYIDRDSGYSAPSSGYSAPSSGYNAPTSSYSAPSYEAPKPTYSAPSYSAPSYDSYGGGKETFNDFLNALAAFLPIGLFLAAIPPNLIVINDTTRRKRRSTEEEIDVNILNETYSFPFLKKIGGLGYSGLESSVDCQQRLLCEMAVFGARDNANSVQKTLAYAAALTPMSLAKYIKADKILQAVREERCDRFMCSAF